MGIALGHFSALVPRNAPVDTFFTCELLRLDNRHFFVACTGKKNLVYLSLGTWVSGWVSVYDRRQA